MTSSHDNAMTAVLFLSADVDVDASRRYSVEARRLMAKDGLDHLVVDLEHVAFIDSSGIGLLVEIRSECLRRGIDLVLRSVPQRTSALLHLSGLTDAFRIAGSAP